MGSSGGTFDNFINKRDLTVEFHNPVYQPYLLLFISIMRTALGDRQGTLDAVDTFCLILFAGTLGAVATFCLNQANSDNSTQCSQVVSHPSADQAQYGLTFSSYWT